MNTLFQTDMPFGQVSIGGKAELTYNREAGGMPIKKVETSCGCSAASWSADSTFVHITYHAPTSWPEGVWGSEMIVEKYATVFFADDTTQTIKLTGKVVR